MGLIGNNGTGKTTLFRMILGAEFPGGGRMVVRKGIKIGYLEQNTDDYNGQIIRDILSIPFSDVYESMERLESLESKMAETTGKNLDYLLDEYGKLQSFVELKDGYNTESKIFSVATGLGIDAKRLSDNIDNLSGGERTRIFLCKLLLEEPDLLLLDEPTNHLDIIAIGWLEKFLSEYRGTVITVSHDRKFLDNSARKIVEIEGKTAVEYPGNYSWYKREKEKRKEILEKQFINQQKEIWRLESAAKQMREWASQADNEKMFKRAASVEKRIDAMEKLDKPVSKTNSMKMNLMNKSKSGREVIRLRDISKSFSGKIILDGIDLLVRKGEKIVVSGENGCGKTTLVNIMMNSIKADSGSAVIGHGITTGYLPQEVPFDDGNRTLLDEVRHALEADAGRAHKVLAAYGFKGETVMKKIKNLSGGERKRLRFCTMMQKEYNLLIMDEPTNHMDIDSREILEDSLLGYSGTCLFISHDRFFIEKISTDKYLLADGKLINYTGDYSVLLANNKENVSVSETETEKKEHTGVLSNNRLIEIKKTEVEIGNTENTISDAEEEMSGNLPLEKLESLYKRKKNLDEQLDRLYEQWDLLNEP